MRRIIPIALSLVLAGCIRHYFQPPKPAYQFWTKPGASELDIKKALLECGHPSPDPTVRMYEHAFGYRSFDEAMSHGLMSDACMDSSGFKHKAAGFSEACSWPHNKLLPACQPGVEIPAPSVERRLNSWHCKIKTNYAYCLEHAVNPPACDPERDGRPPPPECVP